MLCNQKHSVVQFSILKPLFNINMCWGLLCSINLKIELVQLVQMMPYLFLIMMFLQLLIMDVFIIIMIHIELILNQYMLSLVVRDSSNQISQLMIKKRPHLLTHKIPFLNYSEEESSVIHYVISFIINMWQWYQLVLKHMMMTLLLILHKLIYILK